MTYLIRQKESLYEGISARYLTGVSEDYRRTFTPLTYNGLERKYQNEPNTEIKFRRFTSSERVSFCLYYIAITVITGFSVLCFQEFRESLYLWLRNRKFCVVRWNDYSHLSAVDSPLISRAHRRNNYHVIEVPTISSRSGTQLESNAIAPVVRGVIDPSICDSDEESLPVEEDRSGRFRFTQIGFDSEEEGPGLSIVNTTRVLSIHRRPSVHLTNPGISSSVLSEEDQNSLLMQLEAWCKEGAHTQVAGRVNAANKILTALKEGSRQLDLGNLSLDTLPDCFQCLSSIEELMLDYNQLVSLPDSMVCLTNLKSLSLNNNTLLSSLPDFMGSYSKLEHLSIERVSLGRFPRFIESLTSLRYLFIGSFRITDEVPDIFGSLKELRILSLEGLDISEIPASIMTLSNLEELNLSRNNISVLPESIENLAKLRSFAIVNNEINTLPSSFYNLVNLRCLYAGGNQISSFSEDIRRLTELERFCIEGNPVTALPNSIGELANLRRLAVSRCESLTALPASCSTLSNLRSVYLDASNIAIAAPFVSHWAALESVEVLAPNSVIFGPMEFSTLSEAINACTNLSDQASLSSIEKTILSICKKVKEELPDLEFDSEAFLLTLQPLIDHEQKEVLSLFLTRLKETDDYKNGHARKNFLIRLMRVLKDAAVDEIFGEMMFTIMQDATATCGDRVALAFNEIELQQAILCRSSEVSKEELVDLAIGCRRLEILNLIAAEKIDEDSNKEQIEVYLFLRVKLREALGLPVNTEGMLYSFCAHINGAELHSYEERVKSVTSKKEDILNILVDFNPWKERLKKEHKADFEAVIAEIDRMQEVLEESSSTMKENDYIRAMEEIQRKKEEDTAKLIHFLTEAWISEKLSKV